MRFDNTFWYRYISFEPAKVGRARLVKNTIYGIGIDADVSRFYIWFVNTNEKVFVEYEDLQKLDAASRPYNGKINGEQVESGVTPTRLLAIQSSMKSNVVPEPSDIFRRPKSNVKEKSQEVVDQRSVDVLREMLKSYPYVYGLTLRPYDSHFVVDEPHIFMTQGEWYSLGNDHDDRKCHHGVVCYSKRIGVDDAKSFDMYPLTSNTLSASAWEEEVEDWLTTIVTEAEVRIYAEYGSLTSKTIREFTSNWVRSEMHLVKYDLSRDHPQWVESSEVSSSKWTRMQEVLADIKKNDIEALLNVLAKSIANPSLIREVEEHIVNFLKTEDPSMNLERLDEWMGILEAPSRRVKFAKDHPFYKNQYGDDVDESIKNFDDLEDACWEINESRIKRTLTAWIDSREAEKQAADADKTHGNITLPNRAVISEWVTPHPITLRMTSKVISLRDGALRPCTDQRIIDLMNEIVPLIGNRVSMRLDHLVWGIGNSTSMVTYRTTSKQLLTICPEQIIQIYGRCDLDTLGSAVTHEMAHYVLNQVVKNSDEMKFKREAAGINLHNSQNNASGSTYPFYHEQFAMLAEYGVWNTCARGLQSTKGWEIVNKYFNIETHITPDVIKLYQK